MVIDSCVAHPPQKMGKFAVCRDNPETGDRLGLVDTFCTVLSRNKYLSTLSGKRAKGLITSARGSALVMPLVVEIDSMKIIIDVYFVSRKLQFKCNGHGRLVIHSLMYCLTIFW